MSFVVVVVAPSRRFLLIYINISAIQIYFLFGIYISKCFIYYNHLAIVFRIPQKRTCYVFDIMCDNCSDNRLYISACWIFIWFQCHSTSFFFISLVSFLPPKSLRLSDFKTVLLNHDARNVEDMAHRLATMNSESAHCFYPIL